MDIPSPVLQYLERLHTDLAACQEGEVASYIPELAHADSRLFGICLATIDGQVYEVGDTRHAFTIQSISKPFTYALALERHGSEEVFRRVGVEPSGDAFNAISLDPETGRPANPMINAGAIAATSLLAGNSPNDKMNSMLEAFGRFAGHPLPMDGAVYASERDTGFRNQAIAFLLRNFGILEGDPVALVDLYFRQCSLLVTCRDLAVMAAMLARGGINPLTGVRALGERQVESALSVMGSCGMYDYAGEWTFTVGLPAKSGVSGGILAVLPGHLGIGVFSPPLDARGNSVRGIAACQALSRNFGLHVFKVPRANRTVIHKSYSAQAITSNRMRSEEESDLLKAQGERIHIYELQGELSFGTAEIVVREVLRYAETQAFVILDFKRVTDLNEIAEELLSTLGLNLARQGKTLVFTACKSLFASRRTSQKDAETAKSASDCPVFCDIDYALEWCEDRLLADALGSRPEETAIQPADLFHAFALLRHLSLSEQEALEPLLCPLEFQAGEVIVQEGAPDSSIFFLTRGKVSIVLGRDTENTNRLATFTAGMSFGEMGLLEQAPRSATVVADSQVACRVLKREALEPLWNDQPSIRAIFMENLASDLSRKLRRTNGIISALSQ